MLSVPSNLDTIFIAFSKNFEDAYMSEAAPLLAEIGQTIPSNTRDQRYPFVQAISGSMRKWTGERQVQNVVVDGFVVTNAKYENTLAIERTDIEDDQLNIYTNMLIPNLARHAKLLPDLEIASVIEANAIGFDGVAFFSASHPIDLSGASTSATQSNLATGTPLNSTNLAIVQARMMNFKGSDNIAMGSYGNVLLVPPSLKYTADVLANSTFFPDSKNAVSGTFGSQTNVFQGQYKVVVSPYLTDSGDPTTAVWYLLDCRSPRLRPFFWQEREAPQLVSVTDPANIAVFMQDKYWMGCRARGAAAGSLYFKAFRATGA